jgi:hypothetical protein
MLQWLSKCLSPDERESIVQFASDPTMEYPAFLSCFEEQRRNSVVVMRGLLAGGLLQHCLQLRPSVDFGVPSSDRKKKLAVPYTAADTPSLRSEFAQPDKVR